MTLHIEGSNVRPARDIDEATARELLAEAYDRRAMRAEVGGWPKIAAEHRARAAEIRRESQMSSESDEVPTTVYAAVERVLDEHSAWIARPSPDVTKAVAIAAGIAWSLRTDEVRRGEESGWVIEREDSEPSRPMYYTGKDWDYDNLKAVRFARREDAVVMCCYLFPFQPHRIADHMWCP